MKSLALLALVLLPGPVILAQPQTFLANPDASQIHIKLNTTHEVVDGTFHMQSGSITFDPVTSHIAGSIVVASVSGQTGNNSRDKRMHKEILKVEQFADISFEPKSYDGIIATSGDSKIRVSGLFHLLNTTHDLTIPLQIHMDGSKATAKGQFEIPYVQWGLKDPSFLVWKAEKTVAISLDLVGQLSK